MQKIQWKEFQQAQELHDQRYHKDIYYLPPKDRLTHLALHYIKYTGKAAADIHLSLESSDRIYPLMSVDKLTSLVTDTGIVSLSAANALHMHLDEKMIEVPDHLEVQSLPNIYPQFFN